jgi:integrase
MKSKKEHVLRLPLQAVEILAELDHLTYKAPESYEFSSKAKQSFLSENTLGVELHRLGFQVTAHGLRSLTTDGFNENNFNYDWIEKQLDNQEATTFAPPTCQPSS